MYTTTIPAEWRQGDVIDVSVPPLEKDLIKAVPGARSVGVRDWTVPLSWSACLALRGVFGERLEVGPALAYWSAYERQNRIEPALALRHQTDAAGRDDLRSYQRVGVEFLKIAGRALLADDMGTGKTVQTAVALHDLNAFPALIIAPAGVCRQWVSEMERWTGRKLALGRGTAKQRRDAIQAVKDGDVDGLVMNWENLRGHSRLAPYGSVRLRHCEVCDPDGFPGKKQTSCHRCEKELNEVDWVAVAADEAHRGRDPQSQQTRAWWHLISQPSVRYAYALTGTPVDETIDDLWSVMHGVNPHEYPVKSAFVDRYAMLTFNAYGGLEITGINPQTRDEFYGFFDPRFLRRPKAAVLPDLPEKTRLERSTPMKPKQAKAYKELRDDMLTLLDDDEALMVFDPLTLTARLNQAAASYLETTECDDCGGAGENKSFAHHASPHPEERYAATYCWCAEELTHRIHKEECVKCHGTGKVYVPALPSNKVLSLIHI